MIQTTILQTNFGAAALHATLRKQGVTFEAKPVKTIRSESDIMESILQKCVEKTGVKYSMIRAKSRRREYVVTRAYFYYIVRTQHPNISLKRVGNFAGGFDHSTVLYGRDYIIDCLHGVLKNITENKQIAQDIKEIISEL